MGVDERAMMRRCPNGPGHCEAVSESRLSLNYLTSPACNYCAKAKDSASDNGPRDSKQTG